MLPLVLLSFSLLLLNPAVAEARLVHRWAPPPQLRALCRKTSYPGICARTMAPFLNRNTPLNDPMFVFRTSLKAALAQTSAAIRRFDKMIKVEKDEFDRGCLISCKKEYNDAIDDIKKAMAERYYNMVTSTLSACISYIGTCGDDFGEDRVNKAARINEHTMDVIDNSLAFAGLVKWA